MRKKAKLKAKKSFRTLASLFLLAVLVIGCMPQTVLADDATYSITINNSATGHTYTAYQIFKGDYKAGAAADVTGTLSNIVWGDGVNTAGREELVKVAKEAGKAESAAGYAETLNPTDAADAKELAEILVDNNYLDQVAGTATSPTEGKYTISGLSAGYYLVKDVTTDNTSSEGISAYVVEVVGNVDVTPKTGVPTFEKKVQDVNDSKANSDADPKNPTAWQDSADYDIGDSIPFTLTATLPSDSGDAGYQNFDVYYLKFTDDLSDGLTLDETSIKVYVNSIDATKVIAAKNYKVTQETGDKDDFSVTFADLKKVKYGTNSDQTINAGDKIIVTYNASLNENAVIGAGDVADATDGNPNTAYVSYLRNPNSKYDGSKDTDNDSTPDEPSDEDTGETPEDTVTVFTYKLSVDKVNGQLAALAGAEFTLYKLDADNIDDVNKTDLEDTTGKTEHANYYEVKVITNTTDVDNDGAGDLTNFAFSGLDDGKYILVESKTPDGYNTIDPIEFEIIATHDTTSDDPKLTGLTVAPTGGFTIAMTTDGVNPTGLITTEVVNKAGTTLPTTGGIGTTIFYILGAVCVLGAGVLLVTKRVMNKKDID